MKIIGGSILAGLSLLTEILNEWLHHYFFAAYNVAKGISLEGSGSFDAGPYADAFMLQGSPQSFHLFIIVRIIIWLFIVGGVALIVWGLREITQKS